jgi:hypothetical protein
MADSMSDNTTAMDAIEELLETKEITPKTQRYYLYCIAKVVHDLVVRIYALENDK